MNHKHTVKAADGGQKTLRNYTRGLAIKAHCSECCGWESSPAECTATKCALWPFRGKTLATREGSKVGPSGEKQRLETVAVPSEGEASEQAKQALTDHQNPITAQ